ncbi:PrpF domain-containing protein [Rivibacter subsaxonicus]|uniref:2-methylaconitate cis-trans isomerase n=1 Tax=Rivibacter subsaxonicus TaxID=457575 RepID=A0A4Q7VNB4_9BURK|nr:PrpF domain-containing protein [Rivibacter subsaxonicus]RZT97714.1 2-methylaconitate cis-trans isomerase [Rivibacter subsaxonicus]
MKRGLDAVWMRGGTSKGLFLRAEDVRAVAGDDPQARDALLARLLGSPDPYGRQTDGVGGATSSTSKVVLLSRSTRGDADIDYWFGQVDIAGGRIDASGNCGNLSAAVGPAALWLGLAQPGGSTTTLRLWQLNLQQRIDARFALDADGRPEERGAFAEDGVPFASVEIGLRYFEPQGGLPLLPSGRVLDRLALPDGTTIEATLLTAGNPSVIVRAVDLGLDASEAAPRIDADAELLARLEAIRAAGAVAMGLATSAEQATRDRPATPKIAWVGRGADGELSARILSMGRLHHAFTGTGAIALAVAARLPGSVVHEIVGDGAGELRFAHASGRMALGAELAQRDGRWIMVASEVRRSARRLMQGWLPLTPR